MSSLSPGEVLCPVCARLCVRFVASQWGRFVSKLTANILAAHSVGSLSDTQTPGLTLDVTPGGKKLWRFKRRVPARDLDGQPSRDAGVIVKQSGGTYPATNLQAARRWAGTINAEVEAGRDPGKARREAKRIEIMTVTAAHRLYMIAVGKGTASRERRVPKPRTVKDKLAIFTRDIEPRIGAKSVYEVKESHLVAMVKAKAMVAPVRANRLIAELKVFFNWCCSLDASDSIALEVNPATRLHQLATDETVDAHGNRKNTRTLSDAEIGLFFQALAVERETYRRGFALMLLTACRIQEIAQAKASSIRDGVWYREASDVKNGEDHAIPLGAWGRALAVGGSEWVLPCENDPKKPQRYVWYKVRDRLIKRMTEANGGPVGHWKPHDLRRTVRSNTRRFGIDHLTAEAMLAHKLPAGVERIYDRHDPIDDLRRAYGAWEAHLAAIVREAGLGEVFGLPVPQEAEIAAAA